MGKALLNKLLLGPSQIDLLEPFFVCGMFLIDPRIVRHYRIMMGGKPGSQNLKFVTRGYLGYIQYNNDYNYPLAKFLNIDSVVSALAIARSIMFLHDRAPA